MLPVFSIWNDLHFLQEPIQLSLPPPWRLIHSCFLLLQNVYIYVRITYLVSVILTLPFFKILWEPQGGKTNDSVLESRESIHTEEAI